MFNSKSFKRLFISITLLLITMTLASCRVNTVMLKEFNDNQSRILEGTGMYKVIDYEFNMYSTLGAENMEYWIDYYKDGVLQETPVKSYDIVRSGGQRSFYYTIKQVYEGAIENGSITGSRIGDIITVNTSSTYSSTGVLLNDLKYIDSYFVKDPVDIVIDKPLTLGIVVKSNDNNLFTTDKMKDVIYNETSLENYLSDEQSVYIFMIKFTR